jgi:hypothetical protein
MSTTNLTEELKPINEIPESDVVSRMAAASELAENPAIVKEVLKYGKTPVVYGPTKAMLKKPQEPGLRTLIENAMTIKEVTNLLNKGKSDYKNASQKTLRKWELAASKRIGELTPK